ALRRARRGCATRLAHDARRARRHGLGMSATGSATTPSWLLQREPGLCPCGCAGIRRRGSHVEKTLAGTSRVLRDAMFSAEVAERPGLLQALDARVKVVSILGLLVGAELVHHVALLLALYGATVVIAAASRVEVG